MRGCLSLALALVTPVFAWAVDWSGKGVSIVGDSYSAFGYLHGSIHCHYPGKTVILRGQSLVCRGTVSGLIGDSPSSGG